MSGHKNVIKTHFRRLLPHYGQRPDVRASDLGTVCSPTHHGVDGQNNPTSIRRRTCGKIVVRHSSNNEHQSTDGLYCFVSLSSSSLGDNLLSRVAHNNTCIGYTHGNFGFIYTCSTMELLITCTQRKTRSCPVKKEQGKTEPPPHRNVVEWLRANAPIVPQQFEFDLRAYTVHKPRRTPSIPPQHVRH